MAANKLKLDFGEWPFGSGGTHSDYNRFNWRWEMLLTRNEDVIKDAVVLDLACNNGRMSYPCLKLGAKKVAGVEARLKLIEQGKEYLADTEYENRMEWHQSDLFEFLATAKPKSYDVILCFGFLYHTVKQVEFFRQVKRLQPKHVIIDTSVAKNYLWFGRTSFFRKPPALFVTIDGPTKTSNTIDIDGVVYWPSCSFLEKMFDVIGYRYRRIIYSSKYIKDWAGLADYKKGIRASYIAINAANK